MNKLIIQADITPVHYQAGACVFCCIDDNFFDLTECLVARLKENTNMEYIDRVVIPGGAKDLVSSVDYEVASAMVYAEKSIRLHKPRFMVLTTHERCGAYGVEAQFDGNRREQFDFHLQEHYKMDQVVRAKFPDYSEANRIKHYYVSEKGVIELDLKSISKMSENDYVQLGF